MARSTAYDNRTAYVSGRTVKACARDNELFAGEKEILARFFNDLPKGSILDIGIGAGRTTGHLARLGRHYTGVDYSPGMIEAARQRFPALDLRVTDARQLDGIERASRAFVMFSYNGIDSLDHEGRLQVLASVRRVLAPGGIFVFSSHNRNALPPSHARGPARPRLSVSKPFESAREAVQYARSRINARRLHARQLSCETYEIVNDDAYNYSLLNYYISPKHQRQQLEGAGYALLAMLDVRGIDMGGNDDSSQTPMVHYVCRPATG